MHSPHSDAAASSWQWLDQGLAVAGALLVLALLATVTAGVLTRAANHPLAWTDEASGYLVVWAACLGWMLATRRHAHIRIRFFLDRMPPALGGLCEKAIQLALVVLGVLVAVYAVQLVRHNADIESVSLPVSAAWLYVPLVPAGVLTALQALLQLAGVRAAQPAVPAVVEPGELA